jgi:hypothetical protein
MIHRKPNTLHRVWLTAAKQLEIACPASDFYRNGPAVSRLNLRLHVTLTVPGAITCSTQERHDQTSSHTKDFHRSSSSDSCISFPKT